MHALNPKRQGFVWAHTPLGCTRESRYQSINQLDQKDYCCAQAVKINQGNGGKSANCKEQVESV